MSLLVSNEIYTAICNELKDAKQSVQIITAYCKENTLRNLMEQISENIDEKKLMVRFRLDDLIKGSTDFDILEVCLKENWEVYIRFDLHAKTYIVDNKRGIVGSANATKSGMLGQGGNYEIATLDILDESDIVKIHRMYRDSILVDEDILNKLKIQYDNCEINNQGVNPKWSEEITGLFNPHIDSLFSHELPDVNEINNGDYIGFLDEKYDGNWEDLKESFRWSNAYLWLLTTLKENDGCMFFGALTAKLHDALVTDPKPYRKDVKMLLANLLELTEKFEMEEIIVDRPNYSQRVRLKSTIV